MASESRKVSLIRELAEEAARREGLELVDATVSAGGRKTLIRVFVHRSGGASIEDCRQVSRSLDTMLEVEDSLIDSYVLEVSSPGLTRQLTTAADFRRGIGQKIEAAFCDPDGLMVKKQGVVRDLSDGVIILETEDGNLEIPLEAVTKARPIIDWKEIFSNKPKRNTPEEKENGQ
jgi:ribosome maturation factor RimP